MPLRPVLPQAPGQRVPLKQTEQRPGAARQQERHEHGNEGEEQTSLGHVLIDRIPDHGGSSCTAGKERR